MAFKHATLTLTGAAQRLSDAFLAAGEAVGTVNAALDLPCTALVLQGLKANTNDIFVGSASTVSSTSHAFRVDATDGNLPVILPTHKGAPLKPSDLYVLGTNAEVLCIGLVLL